MSGDFMIGSECADWWDQQLKDYEKELEEYVLENPGYWGIAVATAKATGAEFANVMFVDLARVGEGFAKGGVKGFVQDIARIVSVLPQGRILKGAKPASGIVTQALSNIRVWRTCRGGLCAPISVAQALQRTGTKLAVGLHEIAEAIKVPLIRIFKTGTSISRPEFAAGLTRLGLQFEKLAGGTIKTFPELMSKARSVEGPIMVAINGTRWEAGKLVSVGHAVLVGKTATGVKIIDRTGFVRNFDELARIYGLQGKWAIITSEPIFVFANAVIDPSLIKLVERNGVLAVLVRSSMAVLDFNRSKVDPEFVKKDFQRFVEQRGGARRKITLDPIEFNVGKVVTVQAGVRTRSTLSGIAIGEYGDWKLWPLIYDANRDVVGPNPNRLRSGQKLRVLPLSAYDGAEIASARRRAPSWKDY